MQPKVGRRRAYTRNELAAAYERGAQAALAGEFSEAEALLTNVWDAAQGEACDLGDAAALGLSWLMLQAQNYRAAAEWFGRATSWPSSASQLWPLARQVVGQHLRTMADADSAVAHSGRPPQLPLLSVTTLGRFNVNRAGTLLPQCKARKAVALLRYLLTRKQYIAHKDELAELLWPDAAAGAGSHSLHVAVAALRNYLDPPNQSYIIYEAGYYGLAPEAPIVDDAQRFTGLVERADQLWQAGELAAAQRAYAGAVTYYGGDYFVDDRDASWAVAQRERLLVCYLTTLERLGRSYELQHQIEPAVETYRRLLDHDSFREDIHLALMRCYCALGRRGEAMRQYETCRDNLLSELGLEPADELQRLYHELVEEKVDRHVVPSSAPPAANLHPQHVDRFRL